MKNKSIIIICIVAAVIMCLGLLMSVAAMERNEDGKGGNFIADIFDNIVDAIVPKPETTPGTDTEPEPDTEPDTEPDSTIVAEIYVGDDTDPYMQLTREDVIEKINQTYHYDQNGIDSNIFSAGSSASKEHGILWKNDVRVEILQDIDIGNNGLRFETSSGHTLNINGNGHKLSGSYIGSLVALGPNITDGEAYGGTVTIHDLEIYSVGTACIWSLGDGLSLNLNSCEIINECPLPTGHTSAGDGLLIDHPGTFNINSGTHIKADIAINSIADKPADIIISSGAVVEGRYQAVHIQSGNEMKLHISGVVRDLEERQHSNAIWIGYSVGNVNVSVSEGTIVGWVYADNLTTLNLVSGTLEGIISGIGDDPGPTIYQKDEFTIIDPFEVEG